MGSADIQAQHEQNPDDNSSNETVLDPDFSHRYLPLTCGTNISNLTDTLDYSVIRANSVLSLIRKLFADGSGRLNYEEVYYSFVTVKMDIDDMRAVVSAFQQETVNNQPQADNVAPDSNLLPLPIDSHFLDAADKIIVRASGVLSLLCDRFLGDDVGSSNNELITGAIDAVMLEIANIGNLTIDSHRVTSNQQA